MQPVCLDDIIKYIEFHGLRGWLIKALASSFREARKNKLKTFNEHRYDTNWFENIIHLADAVLERYYQPSSSISFVVYEPMIREIFAAPFVDRVIHHFLYQMQAGWWYRRLIPDAYSCRIGKGTLYAVQRVQRMMQLASHNFTEEAFVMKIDISGYFMSLPREKLLARVKWGLDHQFARYMNNSAGRELYKLCYFLWHQILLDDPVSKSHRRGTEYDWKVLPPEKSLYTRPPGRGIVIGNLTSQLVSNIYLDQLDRFMKFDLGYDYYGRYVDDIIRIVNVRDYERAKADNKVIENYLKDELELTMHPKKRYCQSIYKGVPFLGARIYPHCLYPSNRIQAKFKRALAKFSTGEIKDETLASYLGFLEHLDADKYVKYMFEKYGYDFKLYQEFKDKKHRRNVRQILDDLRSGGGSREKKEETKG